MRAGLFIALLLLVELVDAGCQGVGARSPTTFPSEDLSGLTRPAPVQTVLAQCVPPLGWKPDPLKKDDRHTHQVWLSPSGNTAYGVIHFALPLPVGVNIVYWQFLREMKNTEGQATLIQRQDDPTLPGIRFTVDDPNYRTRFNLIVKGFQGWAVYAGTERNQPIAPAELQLAERARDHTVVGLP